LKLREIGRVKQEVRRKDKVFCILISFPTQNLLILKESHTDPTLSDPALTVDIYAPGAQGNGKKVYT
jgi:hypothetical protein